MAAAKRAAAAAQRAGAHRGGRAEDPGYYLVSDGRPVLEKEIGYQVPIRRRLLRAFLTSATPRYLVTISVVTGALLLLPLLIARGAGMPRAGRAVLALCAVIPASDLAVALVNRAIMALLGPMSLPRLELRDGVPPDLRTLVVVPTLLTSAAEIDEQVNRLEVHYLANPDGHLHFALLSDWVDAPNESIPGDDELLAAAVDSIARLNKRHGPGPDGGERFFLFHRRRVWNESERKWMGWERKRGKLHELNRLLR